MQKFGVIVDKEFRGGYRQIFKERYGSVQRSYQPTNEMNVFEIGRLEELCHLDDIVLIYICNCFIWPSKRPVDQPASNLCQLALPDGLLVP